MHACTWCIFNVCRAPSAAPRIGICPALLRAIARFSFRCQTSTRTPHPTQPTYIHIHTYTCSDICIKMYVCIGGCSGVAIILHFAHGEGPKNVVVCLGHHGPGSARRFCENLSIYVYVYLINIYIVNMYVRTFVCMNVRMHTYIYYICILRRPWVRRKTPPSAAAPPARPMPTLTPCPQP